MKGVFGGLRKAISFVLPQEEHFYQDFTDMLENIKKAIELIKNIKTDDVENTINKVEELENLCDEIEERISMKLKSSITTPPQLGRSDILNIAAIIDNLMDSLNSIARRLKSGNGDLVQLIRKNVPEFDQIIDLLNQAAIASIRIMGAFSRNKINADDKDIQMVHDIENKIDEIHIKFVTEKIYNSQYNGKDMVTYQIIGRLEGIGDGFQSLIKIIQGVLVSG